MKRVMSGKASFRIAFAALLICALVASLLLLVNANPRQAYAANDLAAGSVASGSPTSSANASKATTKTVYVLTSVSVVTNGKSNRSVAGYLQDFNYVTKAKVNFTYNAKGLLAKSKWNHSNQEEGKAPHKQSPVVQKWTYDKKNRISKLKLRDYTVSYKYNSKGKLAKTTDSFTFPATSTFAYKSGKVSKVKEVRSGTPKIVQTLTFAYKNGKPVKTKKSCSSPKFTNIEKYAYDQQGNLQMAGDDNYVNTYGSNGLLTKRTTSSSYGNGLGATDVITYKYKAVKVKSSLASKIEAQQWALLNGNLNLAINPNVNSAGNVGADIFDY